MKKGLSLLLVVAMIFTLTACKSKDTATEETQTAAPEATTAAETTTAAEPTAAAETAIAAGIDGWTPFAERVTLTVPVYDRGVEGQADVTDNYWTKWIQTNFGEKYNIDVKYVAIPRGDVMTKYSLLIASGETPTIMMEYDYPKVAQWANDGAMQTIDLDAFAQVAPNYYQGMVDRDQLKYSQLNGENYFVLSEAVNYQTNYTWVGFVRMDWLRQVGYDHVPQNYTEYMDAMDKIKAAGLCDNPVNLSLPTSGYVTNYAYRDYPVNEEEWIQNSSLSVASLSWNPTYKMLKRLNNQYSKGLISKEFELLADADIQANFINGKSYGYAGYMSASVPWLNSFYEANPTAELAVASVYTDVEPGVVDQPVYRCNNSFGMIVGFSATATEDQLKAAWMYMEWLLQPETLFTMENGIEGTTYTLDANGFPVIDSAYTGEERLGFRNNIDYTCIVHNNKKVGDTIEDNIKAITPVGLPQEFYDQIIAAYKDQQKLYDSGYAYTDPLFSVTINSESEYSASLLELYKEDFSKLIKADPAEFDALYTDLAKAYDEAGYATIKEERLQAYKDGNSTKLPDTMK